MALYAEVLDWDHHIAIVKKGALLYIRFDRGPPTVTVEARKLEHDRHTSKSKPRKGKAR